MVEQTYFHYKGNITEDAPKEWTKLTKDLYEIKVISYIEDDIIKVCKHIIVDKNKAYMIFRKIVDINKNKSAGILNNEDGYTKIKIWLSSNVRYSPKSNILKSSSREDDYLELRTFYFKI